MRRHVIGVSKDKALKIDQTMKMYEKSSYLKTLNKYVFLKEIYKYRHQRKIKI